MSGRLNESPETTLNDIEPAFDHRDQAVLDILEQKNPDRVSLQQLRSLYRKATDVRQSETLKERIRFLTTEGPFEHAGGQTWTYSGDT